jgi:alpha-L-rhamnosidase
MANRERLTQPVAASEQRLAVVNQALAEIPLYEGADTELIVDFGRELTGYFTFEVDAGEGTVLDLYGFEYMRDGERQDTYNLDNTLRYVCREGRQSYTSQVRRGLRYVMLTVRDPVRPVRLHRLQVVQSTYPVAEIGQFQCSDTLLSQIWQISQYTVRLCMEDTFVDCPAYEQAFWVGDSRNEALFNYYLFGANDIVSRCLRLVPGSKFQTPFYVSQVPSGWGSVIPNWTFLWVIACAEYYQQTGDAAFARDLWPHVRYTLDHYLERLDNRGLLSLQAWSFLDWAPMDSPRDGVVTHQNLFLARALQAASELAKVGGDEAGSSKYASAGQRLREEVNRHLWSDERRAYLDCIHADGRPSTTFSLQTQIAAYVCDAAQDGRAAHVEQYLLAPPPEFVRIGSPFMSFFYYEALAKLGRFDMIVDDIRSNYGQMIEHGATTVWEEFPKVSEHPTRVKSSFLTRSHCHAWSAAPAYFLGAYVLGARSAAPGWSEVLVEPQPCGLTWARGTVPLPGERRIDVSWRLEPDDRTMHLQVWAPPDVRVSARLPEGYGGRVERFEL